MEMMGTLRLLMQMGNSVFLGMTGVQDAERSGPVTMEHTQPVTFTIFFFLILFYFPHFY